MVWKISTNEKFWAIKWIKMHKDDSIASIYDGK